MERGYIIAAAIIIKTCVPVAGTSRRFWVSPGPVERAPVHASDRGRRKARVAAREREKGIYRKMGLGGTFFSQRTMSGPSERVPLSLIAPQPRASDGG